MEIKKKLVETKDKVKNWCEEHKREIRDIVWYCFGAAVGGVVYYYIGKSEGHDDGMKDADRIWFASFGKELGKDKLTTINNVDTGFYDAICTDEFMRLIEENSRSVQYEDGSWEFESEVK